MKDSDIIIDEGIRGTGTISSDLAVKESFVLMYRQLDSTVLEF